MSAGFDLERALVQNRHVRAAKKADNAERMARAVANVLDGSCESCVDAARGQGVTVDAVRRAVAAARKKP